MTTAKPKTRLPITRFSVIDAAIDSVVTDRLRAECAYRDQQLTKSYIETRGITDRKIKPSGEYGPGGVLLNCTHHERFFVNQKTGKSVLKP
jgi:hypothetical protein